MGQLKRKPQSLQLLQNITREERQVLWEDTFKMWTREIRRNDGGTDPCLDNDESAPFAAISEPASCKRKSRS